MTKVEVLTAMLSEEMVKNNAEYKAFVEHEIELLTKKRKPSKKQLEKVARDNELKKVLVETLAVQDKTIGELQDSNPDLDELSSQKITSLLSQLVKDNKVTRGKRGKQVIFSAVKE